MPKADTNHSIAVLNGQADQINGHPRFMPVEDDGMAPTLTFRHLAAVVPVTKFCGEGLYVLDIAGHANFVRCASMGEGGVYVSRDNPRYGGYPMAWGAFEAGLLGKVAAICDVIDPTLFGRA